MNPSSFRFVLFATGVAAIGGFLFGYDTAVINGSNTYLQIYMDLSPMQEGMAGASAILGCIPGALFAGFLSDRFGRRKLLFLSAILFAMSAVLSAIPHEFGHFLAARFIGGLGIGAASMICPVYIAEISPERYRGRLGTLFQLGIVVGIFVTLFINQAIQGMGDEAWNVAYGWRWMLGMEVVPALIFFLLLWFVPESSRWLAQQGRDADALCTLEKTLGAEDAPAEMAAIRASIAFEEGSFFELFRPPLILPLRLAVALMAISQFCGINAVMYYSSKIFASTGGGKDLAFTSTVWVGLINLVFTFVAIGLVDKAGRRPLLLVGTLVQTIALGLIGWMFYVGSDSIALLLCVLLFIAAFAMALGPISWLFCSEIFPNRVRGRAMSVAALTAWTSCYAVAQTFPMLIDSPTIGPAKTFWVYAAVSLAAFVFVAILLPETRGRSLEEIEQMWRGSKAERGGGT